MRKGIIASVIGLHGGFYLSRPAQEIFIINVVRVIDGVEAYKKCGLGLKNCSVPHLCPLHHDFKKYRNGLAELFSTKSVQDLVQEIQNGQAFIRNSDRPIDLPINIITVTAGR